ARVIAAVVRETRCDGATIFKRWNEVTHPEVHGIFTEPGSQLIDHAFQNESGFGTPRTAVRFDGCGVGVSTVYILFDGRNVVRTRQHEAMQDGRNARRRSGEISAHCRPRRCPQAKYLAVLRGSELDVLDVVAPVRRALVILAARFCPFHWTV